MKNHAPWKEGPELTDKDVKAKAEKRYMESEITLTALAAEMGLSFDRVSRWSRAGKWHKRRMESKGKNGGKLRKLLDASDAVETALLQSARALCQTEGGSEGRQQDLCRIVQAVGKQTVTRLLLSKMEEKKGERKTAVKEGDGVMIQMDKAVEELSE